VTTDEIIAIRDAAQARGDERTYRTAWVALGHHRHPAFLPATEAERRLALTELARLR